LSNPEPWEQDYGFSRTHIQGISDEEKLQIIEGFSQRVLTESVDLDPDIVLALKDDFWSLI